MSEFCDTYNLKNLIKEKTCFKNPNSPSCIDLMLTNRNRSFLDSQAVEIGISDCHKMTISVLKAYIPKQAPIHIRYRDYKNFDSNSFRELLREKLDDENDLHMDFDRFNEVFLGLLDSNAKTKTKFIRANNGVFMSKKLSKAIMNRSRLKNRFLQNPCEKNEINFKRQRNYCVNLLRKEKKKYYSKLNLDSVTNSKKFWKTIKPFFSDKGHNQEQIKLIDKGKIISDEKETAELFNKHFSNIVNSLDIKGYQNDYIHQNNLSDLENIISIMTILVF